MFGTTTKNTGYAARGVEMLGKIRAAVKLPIVAIGGINEQNVTQVWQAGADSAAIISDILGADDVVAKTQRNFRRSRARLSKSFIRKSTWQVISNQRLTTVTSKTTCPAAVHEFGSIAVDEEEVIEFGRRYVPLLLPRR